MGKHLVAESCIDSIKRIVSSFILLLLDRAAYGKVVPKLGATIYSHTK